MSAWNDRIRALPGPHILQTHEWGDFKAQFGWTPVRREWPGAAAQMLVRRIPLQGLSARAAIAYVPKGPLLDWQDAALRRSVLRDLIQEARKQGAFLLKIDPEVRLGTGIPGRSDEQPDPLGGQLTAELRAGGWVFSPDQVQFRNTVLVDLRPDEDALLAAMKQKTRYNIRLAGRRGVAVRAAEPPDFERMVRMYAETSVRDGFVIREPRYYTTLWNRFWEAGMLDPLIAEVDGRPVAAVVVFRFGGKAVYMQGMSGEEHRDRMPNYLLQWEAMRRARATGCVIYDLWGAPDRFEEGDPLWGVYRFKEGFQGTVVRHIGAWDYPVQPLLYRLYTRILPQVLGWMRRRGRDRTQAAIE